MDAALKARKLGSATARRQRMEERQIQQQAAYQERQRRKKEMTYQTSISDESDEDDLTSSTSLDSAAETPSEYSLRTPDDLSPELDSSDSDVRVTITHSVQDEVSEAVVVRGDPKNTDPTLLKPQKRPQMQATLTTVADWNYDRFSMLIDPVDLGELTEKEGEKKLEMSIQEDEQEVDEDAISSDSGDEVESLSPLEIAVPVSYSMPKTRPAMVCIVSSQGRSNSLRLTKPMSNRPNTRRHVSEQLLSRASQERFKLGRPQMFETSNSSQETIDSLNSSVQPSRSTSQSFQNESLISRSTSLASQSDQSHKSPKRKSSLPLLFTANKNGHSRMSSIKKFIRSSTLGPPSTSQHHGGLLQRHPSSSTLETHFESQRVSMDVPRENVVEHVRRPMTARASSPPPLEDITALPPPPVWPTRIQSQTQRPVVEDESKKEKPVSKLRQRRGSIGQALKAISGGPKKSDASMPPVPTIVIPTSTASVDALDQFPAPPPLTPRNPRRTSHYSPFPAADKRVSSAVGLGLRY